MKILRQCLPLILLAIALAACGGDGKDKKDDRSVPMSDGSESVNLPPALQLPTFTIGSVDMASLGTPIPMMEPASIDGGEPDVAIPAGAEMEPTAVAMTGDSGGTGSSGGGVANVPVSPLNAGEIDDNTAWDAHLSYRQNFLPAYSGLVHDVDVSQRQIITVTDPQGLPIIGARVMVYSGQTVLTESRTYATGETLFFPSAWQGEAQQSYRVVVQKEETAVEFSLDPNAGHEWVVELDATNQADSIPLDVLFLLDSTGSMADEIAQLQTNILAISEQINQIPGNVDTRYGLVTYRDRGDAYVTLSYDFVSNVTEFQTSLMNVQAGGGGDTPESLNEALHLAVQGLQWRGDDTIKLIFLVADAAPHLDYANDFDYAQEMVVASWEGIKIHPIASSGLTPDGEYIFRQLAQYTMGRFLFLTYQSGTSGAPGTQRTDLEASTENNNYSVEYLDELVLRLITDEIAALDTVSNTQAAAVAAKPTSPEPDHARPSYFALSRAQVSNTTYANQVIYEPVVAPSIESYVPVVDTASSYTPAKGSNAALGLAVISGLFFGVFLMGAVLGGRFRLRRRKAKNVMLVRVDDDGEMHQIN
ncbi:MAG: VWA domain-containing protein [Anaerolineae bacterium]|nr:VWA domain-containing protein [Anaerolineae bacterium]